jgi:hypothetical protein
MTLLLTLLSTTVVVIPGDMQLYEITSRYRERKEYRMNFPTFWALRLIQNGYILSLSIKFIDYYEE